MDLQTSQNGKLSTKDAKTATLLKHAPWIAVLVTSIPVPLVLLVLFFLSMLVPAGRAWLERRNTA